MDFLQIMEIILIVISAVLAIMIFAFILSKFYHFNTLKFKPELKQKGEYIKDKFFITQDQYTLKSLGHIKTKSKHIIIGVHDLGLNKSEFNAFNEFLKTNEDISFLSYDQRNFGENEIELKRNAGSMIFDLNNIVDDLKEKYPKQTITLLGEGLGYHVSVLVAVNNRYVDNVIAVGPITKVPYALTAKQKSAIMASMFFSHNRPMILSGIGVDLTNDSTWAKIIDNNFGEKGFITVKEYFQIKLILKKSFQALKQLHSKQLIIQPKNDIYLNPKKFEKMLINCLADKLTIDYIDDAKHLVLNDHHQQEVFAIIQKWVQ